MATRPAVQMPRIYNSLVIKPRVSVWDENSVATSAHNLPATQEVRVQSLGQEDAPGGGNGNPLQYSCLENSVVRGAWRATVGKSRTRTHTHGLSEGFSGCLSWVSPKETFGLTHFICDLL